MTFIILLLNQTTISNTHKPDIMIPPFLIYSDRNAFSASPKLIAPASFYVALRPTWLIMQFGPFVCVQWVEWAAWLAWYRYLPTIIASLYVLRVFFLSRLATLYNAFGIWTLETYRATTKTVRMSVPAQKCPKHCHISREEQVPLHGQVTACMRLVLFGGSFWIRFTHCGMHATERVDNVVRGLTHIIGNIYILFVFN